MKVLNHKYYVFKAGRKVGVPILRLIFHDWTKFLPVEFFPYANYNFGGENTAKVQYNFDKAWLHHQNRNDHHWQHWILVYDDNSENDCLCIPDNCILEMVADWMGASKAYTGSWDMSKWLEINLERIQIDKESRKVLINILLNLGYIIEYDDLDRIKVKYYGK